MCLYVSKSVFACLAVTPSVTECYGVAAKSIDATLNRFGRRNMEVIFFHETDFSVCPIKLFIRIQID